MPDYSLLYNGSVTSGFTDDMRLGEIVNNIKNSMPPKGSTYISGPCCNFVKYNVYG